MLHFCWCLAPTHCGTDALRRGELALGTWQGIFFCELDGPRTRSVLVTLLK